MRLSTFLRENAKSLFSGFIAVLVGMGLFLSASLDEAYAAYGRDANANMDPASEITGVLGFSGDGIPSSPAELWDEVGQVDPSSYVWVPDPLSVEPLAVATLAFDMGYPYSWEVFAQAYFLPPSIKPSLLGPVPSDADLPLEEGRARYFRPAPDDSPVFYPDTEASIEEGLASDAIAMERAPYVEFADYRVGTVAFDARSSLYDLTFGYGDSEEGRFEGILLFRAEDLPSVFHRVRRINVYAYSRNAEPLSYHYQLEHDRLHGLGLFPKSGINVYSELTAFPIVIEIRSIGIGLFASVGLVYALASFFAHAIKSSRERESVSNLRVLGLGRSAFLVSNLVPVFGLFAFSALVSIALSIALVGLFALAGGFFFLPSASFYLLAFLPSIVLLPLGLAEGTIIYRLSPPGLALSERGSEEGVI